MEQKKISKVSVIIPVYNVDQFLRKCLDSVVNQTLKDIEIICVNDGSTDNSLAILEEYAAKDERIIIINQENQGVSVARNKGIKASSGEFITFLDSDDTFELSCIELAYNSIIKSNSNIVCFGINRIVNGNSEPRWDSEFLKESPCLENIAYFMQNAAAKLFDNRFLKQNSILFPENIKTCEDGLFCLLCLYHNATFSYLDKNLYNYLIGRDGSACTQQKTIVETDIEAFKYILNTQDFKNAKEEFKVITIEKFFKHFRWNDSPEYRFRNYLRINKFIKYLYKNIDKNIIKKCDLKDIKRYSIASLMMKSLLSAKNSNDKTHKIITICGIKIKIKKRINTQKNYKKVLKRIKKSNKKIKVIFLVSENQKWGYQSLYEKFANDDNFEPLVLISLLTSVHSGFDSTRNNLDENYNFFKSRGMNVEYCYQNNYYIPLESFNPDIVFYEQPWDLPHTYTPQHVSKFALTCHIDYGLAFFSNPNNYMNDFHQLLWIYFVDNPINIERYRNYNKKLSKNCVYMGYPKLDVYLKEVKNNFSLAWKDLNKKRIIYAPHHSFEKESLMLATFNKNGKFILELAKKYNNTTWIFKPHPRFKFSLISNNIMNEKEVEDYYKEWEKIGNVYTQGDYIDIFQTSDLLITDCASFLGEYLPTKKPIIRLVNQMACKFNKFGEIISQACYNVNGNEELEFVFNDITKNGNDPKLEKRLSIIKLIIDDERTSSERMFEYIKKAVI